MPAHRYLISVILLLSLALTGCSKSAKAPNSDNQAAASQANASPDNSAVTDSGASNQPPATPAPEPLVISAGTSITVRLQEGLSSASAVTGERFDAVVDEPITLDDRTVIPVGTPVTGHVTLARRSGRLHHPGELGLTLDTVVLNNQQV